MNPVTRKAVQAATDANVWLYRRTNGQVGGRGIGRLPLLLLTVPGRKTGTPHTVPVAYLDHDGGWIVVGTGMGGSKRTPQWFLNLRTAGKGHVQIGAREHHVTAHLPTSAEQGMLWPHIAAQAPHVRKWQARTGRTLPIIILTVQSAPKLSMAIRSPGHRPSAQCARRDEPSRASRRHHVATPRV